MDIYTKYNILLSFKYNIRNYKLIRTRVRWDFDVKPFFKGH